MDNKQGPGRLWRWVRARTDADAALDAADVGTDLGMELSIEAEQREAHNARADPSAEPVHTAARPRR